MMSTAILTVVMFAALLLLVVTGVHVYIALGLVAIAGVWAVTSSFDIAMSLYSSTLFEALRDFVFATIPLFILMGEFLARSGAAADLYKLANMAMRRVPGRLAVATIAGNAVFAAAVGVSIASAATFTRIAYPEMKKHGYSDPVSLGCVAGSSCLGMLIPPSVLLIIYGMLTEMSIGALFAAGILPGLVLALIFILYVVILALTRPALFGDTVASMARKAGAEDGAKGEVWGGLGAVALIFIVLGGIWFGWFTPTEAAGIGALLALVLALLKGARRSEIVEAILRTGRVSAPLLFLLVFGQFYSRLLSLGGANDLIQDIILGLAIAPVLVLVLMILIWFVLGMFIDSASILLLTIPIFAPIAGQIGFDPLQFAIIAVLAIETGILSPPLGIGVFTVKAAANDPDLKLATIFRGAVPYWLMLLAMIAVLVAVPQLATYLPSVM